MKISKVVLRGSITFIGISFFIFLILSTSGYVAVNKETIPTTSGSSNVIVKSCIPSVPIPANPVSGALCGTIQSNATNLIQSNLLQCPNGGVAVNNTCPTSTTPLPINTSLTIPPVVVKPSEQIQLIPYVVTTDNFGGTVIAKTSVTSLILQSFIGTPLNFVAVSGTNTPFDNGKIDLTIQIKTSPNEVINGNGTLWVTLNNISIHPVGIFWSVNGMTDETGILSAKIQSPQGVLSSYTFNINSQLNNIVKPTNLLNFSISNVKIQNVKGMSYSNSNMQNFYSIGLDYDPYLILSKDSQGNYVRVYPNDDTFTIASNPIGKPSSSYVPCQKGGTYIGDHQVGCGTYYFTIYSPAVPAGSASIYLEPTSTSDGTEKLLGTTSSITSGNSATISNIPRDADIKIVITDGTSPSTKLYHTPKTQQSYSFVCGSSCSFSP